MKSSIEVPDYLTPETRDWFKDVLTKFVLEQHHIKILTLACEAYDRCKSARTTLAEQGSVYIDRFGSPKARPEVSIERDASISFARLLRELDLDCNQPEEFNRPPALKSNKS